ncbi:MAG: methylated-DNA--[protein]-cysteine S-methyltransferase [Verrucomicrobia bacterium]|nr:methylated-DNA--[protein]-cysteine S-methyltransferase [Verrucomicrobiota bacterium]
MIEVSLSWSKGRIASVRLSLSPVFSISSDTKNQAEPIVQWLNEYAKGSKKPFRGILPLHHLTPFQQKVLRELQQIPAGETISYGELGALVGTPNGARAIGGVCHINPFPLLIPCHRVIRSDGQIGGFATDLEIKRRLLAFENSPV